MTAQDLDALKRIAEALETIVERMPTWQQLPPPPSANTECRWCGSPNHGGLPCPRLTPFANGVGR